MEVLQDEDELADNIRQVIQTNDSEFNADPEVVATFRQVIQAKSEEMHAYIVECIRGNRFVLAEAQNIRNATEMEVVQAVIANGSSSADPEVVAEIQANATEIEGHLRNCIKDYVIIDSKYKKMDATALEYLDFLCFKIPGWMEIDFRHIYATICNLSDERYGHRR